MSPPVLPADLDQRVKVLQTIWLALVAGTVTLLGVFYFLRQQPDFALRVAAPVPLAAIFAGVGGLLAVLAFVVPERIAAHQEPSFGVFQTARIVQGALLESAGVLQGVAYLLEGQPWSLGVGGLMVLLLLFVTPTRNAATRWLQRRSTRN